GPVPSRSQNKIIIAQKVLGRLTDKHLTRCKCDKRCTTSGRWRQVSCDVSVPSSLFLARGVDTNCLLRLLCFWFRSKCFITKAKKKHTKKKYTVGSVCCGNFSPNCFSSDRTVFVSERQSAVRKDRHHFPVSGCQNTVMRCKCIP
uniref:Uncharacterized protein n=1 Tax=Anopheles minimus TaxID=112268 RepID=A0A182WQC9_9DIPT